VGVVFGDGTVTGVDARSRPPRLFGARQFLGQAQFDQRRARRRNRRNRRNRRLLAPNGAAVVDEEVNDDAKDDPDAEDDDDDDRDDAGLRFIQVVR
jgi:hypothetical protein